MNIIDSAITNQASHAGNQAPSCRPVLSIVIPAYNVAPFVGAALESALRQTLRDLEVIVVDDGSDDGTATVIDNIRRSYADARLHVVRQENAGLSAARNTGIQAAKGEFIGLLDADDVWMSEKGELQVRAMRRDPSIGISFSHSAYITEDGCRTGSLLLAGKSDPSLHDMIRRNHIGNGSTPIIRQDCFRLAGLFRTELRSCEDYEMWCRILSQTSYRAALVPAPLTLYRLRRSSLSFDSETFIRNADRAVASLREAMPHVPKRVLRVGHAEHYRIAAWKAVTSGRRQVAFGLLMRAAVLRPSLFVSDWRAAGTAVAIALPTSLRGNLARLAKAVQQRRHRPGVSRDPLLSPMTTLDAGQSFTPDPRGVLLDSDQTAGDCREVPV